MAIKLLGLDVGDARIGLAKGELGFSFVFGRGYITRSAPNDDIAKLKEITQDEQIDVLVVGLPSRTDGKDSAQTQKVRAFAKTLEDAGFKVELEDERFTTKLASERLQQGVSKKKRQEKGRLDEASAVLILESYLKRKNAENDRCIRNKVD